MRTSFLYPWKELNHMVGTLHPGEMTVIMGQSGSGKSTFVANCMKSFNEQGVYTFLGSFETSRKVWLAKEACRRLGWDHADVKEGNIDKWGTREELADKYREVEEEYKNVTFLEGLNHHSTKVLERMNAWLSKPEVQAAPFRLVVLDHILQIAYGNGGESTTGQIRQFLNEAMNICKRGKAHLMPTTQLSPEGSRGYRLGQRPTKDWSFGSSALKHLADTMLFIGGKLLPLLKKGLAALNMEMHERYEPGKGAVTCVKSRELGTRFDKKAQMVTRGEDARLIFLFDRGNLYVDFCDEVNMHAPPPVVEKKQRKYKSERLKAAKDYVEKLSPGSSTYC